MGFKSSPLEKICTEGCTLSSLVYKLTKTYRESITSGCKVTSPSISNKAIPAFDVSIRCCKFIAPVAPCKAVAQDMDSAPAARDRAGVCKSTYASADRQQCLASKALFAEKCMHASSLQKMLLHNLHPLNTKVPPWRTSATSLWRTSAWWPASCKNSASRKNSAAE